MKAIRLCSKALAKAATPLLFSDLHIYMSAASFARITAVAEHPELSCLVRSVTVFPKQFQATDLSRADYEYHLGMAGYGSVYKQYQQFENDVSPSQSTVTPFEFSLEGWNLSRIGTNHSAGAERSMCNKFGWRAQAVQEICLAAKRLPRPGVGMLIGFMTSGNRYSLSNKKTKASCTTENSLKSTGSWSQTFRYAF